MTELNLSQATFTRRVKELNEDLVEFHVQIKNGRMKGPELQVRYFYFQLLLFGRPYLVNLQQFSQNAHDQILTFLNKQFNFPYTQDGKIKFEIWLYILQKRLRYGRHETLDYRDLPVHLLQESNFISLMQNTLLRFALQSAFAWNQYESLIFYLFMISSFTLDTTNHFVQDFLLQEKNNDTLVNGLTEQFENTMAHFLPFYTFSKDFSRKINLNVSQNHFRLVYMRGWISVFGRIGLQDRLAHFEDQNLLNLCQTLTDNSLNYLKLSQQDRDFSQVELFGRYASILQLIFKEVELRLQIACDFPYERLMQDIVIEMVRERLINSVKWDLMKYDASSRYDVILSSQIKEYPNAHQAKIFVMLSNEFDFDFPYLNELLKATYLEKMQERMRQVPEFPLEAPLS
ncbi:helix-turn-helix domain-containing protein [Enterococcus timonensis]|uniref:helix-turn-helix domain-containing protein n=1 Tax=Enterococcus timonensis TaxID=1852364 RepID=UPI000D08D15E|nr:helix-turn-helix domain-containing protein [Enterococcus timonensis]